MERIENTEPQIVLEDQLRQVIDEYGVTDEAFVSSKVHTISRALELTYAFVADSGFVQNSHNALLLLSIADTLNKQWIDEAKARTLLGELTDLKIDPVTSSQSQFPRHSAIDEDYLEQWLDNSVHDGLTQHVRNEYELTDEKSILADFRKKHMVSPEKEFDLVVFDRRIDEFRAAFSSVAFVRHPQGEIACIYLPRDATPSIKVHEWIHTQIDLKKGKNNAYDAGVLEAVIESKVPVPTYYVEQREIYERVKRDLGDQIDIQLVQAGRGDTNAMAQVASQFVDGYRLAGFLALTRMSPTTSNTRFYSPQRMRVFLPTQTVNDTLYETARSHVSSQFLAAD